MSSICFELNPETPLRNAVSPGVRMVFLVPGWVWNSSGMKPLADVAGLAERVATGLSVETALNPRAPPLNPPRFEESRVFFVAPKDAQCAFMDAIDAMQASRTREKTHACVYLCVRCATDCVAPERGGGIREYDAPGKPSRLVSSNGRSHKSENRRHFSRMGAEKSQLSTPQRTAMLLVPARVHAPGHAPVTARVPRRSIATPKRVVSTKATSTDDVSLPTTDANAPSPKQPRVHLACPVCLTPFKAVNCQTCTKCNRSFPTESGIIDLCLDAGNAQGAYKEPPQKSGTKLFQNELISRVYENGWRQSFAWAGFPGEDEETAYAMEYMVGAWGGVVLDVSCGSGLFSRRFAASGKFATVVASDFSETMMTQTREYCLGDTRLRKMMTSEHSDDSPSLVFVKAEVGRLPFASSSLDAVHAGAAMHCWPSPSAAVAEISRVLKPGGVFVASTFLDPTAIVGNDEMTQQLSGLFKDSGVGTGGAFNQFFSEMELRDLTTRMCGFEKKSFARKRNRQFIMFKVTKPSL